MAVILRVADALDRSLLQVVDDVKLERRVVVPFRVYSEGDALVEVMRAQEKAELFEKVFDVWVKVERVERDCFSPN